MRKRLVWMIALLVIGVLAIGCGDATNPLTNNTGDRPSLSGSTAATTITIDIKPGTYPNMVNLDSQGKVIVAILTTDTFDAANVDPETVLFGDAAPFAVRLDDVDEDGDKDLACHFDIPDLILSSGSSQACLSAKDWDGVDLLGCDQVGIVARCQK